MIARRSVRGFRRAVWILPVLGVAVLVTACGSGRSARSWFRWASVPACQAAIRSRALSEFGPKAAVHFDGPAEENNISKGRVRVQGTATVERKKGDDVKVEYECITRPKQSELVSAKYWKAK
jgi:hypothetical protein